MICLKSLDTMLVLPGAFRGAEAPFAGFYYRDTRFLSRYEWEFRDAPMLFRSEAGPGSLMEVFSSSIRHGADWAVLRQLFLNPSGFVDEIFFENYSLASKFFECTLSAEADFVDMMALRLPIFSKEIPEVKTVGSFSWRAFAGDGIPMRCDISFSPEPAVKRDGSASWAIEVPVKGRLGLRVTAEFSSDSGVKDASRDGDCGDACGKPNDGAQFYAGFSGKSRGSPLRKRFEDLLNERNPFAESARIALYDIESLMLIENGMLVPAAGLPYFAVPFGRDSFIAAGFFLGRWPELAEGVLRYAASIQGTQFTTTKQEEPGKIFHEARPGELSRRGIIPFSRYYGSADSTLLFLILLGRFTRQSGNSRLSTELRDSWRAALAWLRLKLEDGGGFIRFSSDFGTTGLEVQSWKDSKDSMGFPDGSLAEPPLAVSEIQAYAYGALMACSDLSAIDGDANLSIICRNEARALSKRIREKFWLAKDSLYALALDGNNQALETPSSDAGHFFPYCLESVEEARALAARLLKPDLFSGWGVRTLSDRAARYNPLSYHNGAVWPHDNAIIADGMFERGLHSEAARICEAVLTAVSRMEGARAPELFAGYPRDDVQAPVPHPFACSPQAWSAAGALRMCDILMECREGSSLRSL